MKKTVFVATLALVALCGAASAQVTGVVTQAGAQLQFNPVVDFGVNGLLTYTGQNLGGLVYDGDGSTSQFTVTSLLQPNDIQFANGATSSGAYIYSTTSTSIAVTFTNNGPVAVRPQLQSAIVPGGFGLYVANTSGCQPFATAACTQVTPASGLGFASLATRNSAAPIGGAAVSFTISSGSQVLYSLSGSIDLFYNPAKPSAPIFVTTLGNLAATLNKFQLETPAGSASAMGYNWGATNLLVNFPPGLLAPGASDSLTYTTVVSSFSHAGCNGVCDLVGYSGFGDPIGLSGGSGGDEAVIREGPFAAFQLGAGNPNLIQGVSYSTFTYGIPTFDNGVLSLPLLTGVPEPAGWALMVLGTALVGLGPRRRRAWRRA